MESSEPALTIAIPVFNEAGSIAQELRGLASKVRSPFSASLVYDFEEDDTLPVAKSLQQELGIDLRFVRNSYRRGVLGAIKTGLETASAKYVLVTMADLSDPPEAIDAMLAKAEATGADIVCGSRYMKGGSQRGGPLLKSLLSRLAGLSLHRLARVPTHDATNSFKLYRKSFLEQVTIESSGGFELGLELVVKAHLGGFKIEELPVSWTDRSEGKSKFKLFKWLPKYLKWYLKAFLPANRKVASS